MTLVVLALSPPTRGEPRPGFHSLRYVVDEPIYAEITLRLDLSEAQRITLDPVFHDYLHQVRQIDGRIRDLDDATLRQVSAARHTRGPQRDPRIAPRPEDPTRDPSARDSIDDQIARLQYEGALATFPLHVEAAGHLDRLLSTIQSHLDSPRQRELFAGIRPLIYRACILFFQPDAGTNEDLAILLDFTGHLRTMLDAEHPFGALLAAAPADTSDTTAAEDSSCDGAKRRTRDRLERVSLDFEQRLFDATRGHERMQPLKPIYRPGGVHDLKDPEQRRIFQRTVEFPRQFYAVLRDCSNDVLAHLHGPRSELEARCGSEPAMELAAMWTSAWRTTMAPTIAAPTIVDLLGEWCERFIPDLDDNQLAAIAGIEAAGRISLENARAAAIAATEAELMRPPPMEQFTTPATGPILALARMRNVIATTLNQTRAILTDAQRASYDARIEKLITSASRLLGPSSHWNLLANDPNRPFQAVPIIHGKTSWSFIRP